MVCTGISRTLVLSLTRNRSASQIVTQLYDKIVLWNETIGNGAKNRIMGAFSETDKRLVDGSDEHLTVLDLCLQISGMLGADK